MDNYGVYIMSVTLVISWNLQEKLLRKVFLKTLTKINVIYLKYSYLTQAKL